MTVKFDPYVITDEGLSKGLRHAEIARLAIAGGADVIQLRDKRLDGRALTRCALEIRELTKKARVLFIVNDRLDVALAAHADGVHLGQEDMPVRLVRPLCPPGFIIGASAGTPEEALRAERDGADYIGLGPICHTDSKSDAGPACGFDVIKEVKKVATIPVVAIGGMGPSSAEDAILAGADGIAVISAVVSQDDVAGAARHLRSIIEAAKHRKVYEG